MKPLLTNWTVVLAGRWNMEILNPEWVAQKIFEKENIDIDLVLNGMQTNIRYRFDNLVFVPQPGNVIFSVDDTSDESLQSIESAACKLLKTLPVTPMTALGINFTFVEDDTPLNIAKIFNVSDTSKIAEQGYKIRTTRVRREIEFEDRQLNLIMTQMEENKTRIALNFHYPTLEPADALRMLENRVVDLCHAGQSFLAETYGLRIEDQIND